jgi:hypothetical protein
LQQPASARCVFWVWVCGCRLEHTTFHTHTANCPPH